MLHAVGPVGFAGLYSSAPMSAIAVPLPPSSGTASPSISCAGTEMFVPASISSVSLGLQADVGRDRW